MVVIFGHNCWKFLLKFFLFSVCFLLKWKVLSLLLFVLFLLKGKFLTFIQKTHTSSQKIFLKKFKSKDYFQTKLFVLRVLQRNYQVFSFYWIKKSACSQPCRPVWKKWIFFNNFSNIKFFSYSHRVAKNPFLYWYLTLLCS